MMQLQDPERTKVLLVTLPETTCTGSGKPAVDLERWDSSLGLDYPITAFRCLNAIAAALTSAPYKELPQIEVVKTSMQTASVRYQ